MYGQMTAGSWIYIGTQGILQGTYETFAELARRHFDGTLRGRIVLTAGVGGMGGAQPLAVTMNDGVCLVIDVDRSPLDRRMEYRLSRASPTRATRRCGCVDEAKRAGKPLTVGSKATPPTYSPRCSPRRPPDVAHRPDLCARPARRLRPAGLTLSEAGALRASDPAEYERRAARDDGAPRRRDAGDEGRGRGDVRLRQ